MTKTREQIEAQLAELRAANEKAPGWGAAVGARNESIRGLERQLRALDPPTPTIAELTSILVGEARRWGDCRRSGDEAEAAERLERAVRKLEQAIDAAADPRKNPRTAGEELDNLLIKNGLPPRD
jgi:hypothetical protein